MAEPYAAPRRFPRVKIIGNVTGATSLLREVTLLDLSEGGARLEHAGRFALPPGAGCRREAGRRPAAGPGDLRLAGGYTRISTDWARATVFRRTPPLCGRRPH